MHRNSVLGKVFFYICLYACYMRLNRVSARLLGAYKQLKGLYEVRRGLSNDVSAQNIIFSLYLPYVVDDSPSGTAQGRYK